MDAINMRQAAAEMDLNPEWLYTRLVDGTLPGERLEGGRWLVRRSDYPEIQALRAETARFVPRAGRERPPCQTDGCNGFYYSRGWCKRCYHADYDRRRGMQLAVST